MSVIEIIAGSFMILSCIVIIIAVSLQSGKGGSGLSVLMGGDGGGSKGKGKEADAKLARVTRWLAAIVFLVSLFINILVLL